MTIKHGGYLLSQHGNGHSMDEGLLSVQRVPLWWEATHGKLSRERFSPLLEFGQPRLSSIMDLVPPGGNILG
jgi:hypothetical protein